MANVGYWVDLRGLSFDDPTRTTWVQALPLGQYKHPLYGKIDVTMNRVQLFANNVKNQVRGQELDIDYDHKQYSGKAAGWVKDAEARPNGLWVKVEWTEDAYGALQKGEYRYFSPEFADKWSHPKTGDVHQDVLFGGALTNRPFLKDILPINMSELTGGEQVDKFLEELRKALKLNEDATEEEILQAAQDASAEEQEEEKEEEEESGEGGEGESQNSGEPAELSEELRNSPVIKKLLEDVSSLQSENRTLKATTKLSEVNTKLGEWSSASPGDNAKFALPPAVHDDMRTIMLSENGKSMKAFSAVIDHILEHGLVRLGEQGGDKGSARRSGGGSATKRMSDRIEELRKGDTNLDYVTAAGMVASEDPDLYAAYREEVLTDSTGE